MDLILVRHPETTYNAAGNRYCGRTDAPLSDVGLEQVEALRRFFRAIPLGAVLSSPLIRARACAEAIAGDQGLSVGLSDDITEFDFGAWEGLRPAEIQSRDAVLWDQWNAGHPFAAPPEGERPIDVYSRVVGAIAQLAAQAGPDEPVLIVSHDQVIRMMFTFFLSLPFWHFRRLGQPRNGSICRVRGDLANGTWRMLAYSETV